MRAFLAVCLLSVSTAVSASASCVPANNAAGADIYPTANVLPENLLRFYIYFPAPMGHDDIMDHIQLFDGLGHPIDDAFLRNRLDLWSPDRTRLTLLLDPGRVKTGLAAHDALGRAFEEGQKYTLAVRGTATTEQGCEMGEDAFHIFVAGPADTVSPVPDKWDISPIQVGTSEAIEVDLGRTHDHLSMAYKLRVVDTAGVVVRGFVAFSENERIWQFKPRDMWSDQTYMLKVDHDFEDLAGNRPNALFEQHQLGQHASSASDPIFISLDIRE
ncbi:MAG: hypothetical protein AAGJ34_11295 [Pseudomonadota bacterium]